MGQGKNKEIQCPNIILCEGRDVTSFIIYYLGFLSEQDIVFDSFQALDFGGISELTDQLKAFTKMPQFSMVRSILIIRDAEKSYVKAKNDIAHTCKEFGISNIEKPGVIYKFSDTTNISYLLLPSLDDKGDENGALEDLCLKLIKAEKHKDVANEVDNFLDVLRNDVGLDFPRIHKNKLHLMISSYDKYVDAKVGEAGQRGMYDFNSPKLDYLRSTLARLNESWQK